MNEKRKRRFRLRRATPVEVRQAFSFGKNRFWTVVEFPIYDETVFGLLLRKKRRTELGLSLRDAASLLGLRPFELSDLERGRLLADHDDQLEMLRLLSNTTEPTDSLPLP